MTLAACSDRSVGRIRTLWLQRRRRDGDRASLQVKITHEAVPKCARRGGSSRSSRVHVLAPVLLACGSVCD